MKTKDKDVSGFAMKKYSYGFTDRLSVPAPNRTLTSIVRKWGEPVFYCHQQIKDFFLKEDLISTCRSFYLDNYSTQNSSLNYLNDDTILNLYASAIVMNWISGLFTGSTQKASLLSDAEKWFLGKSSKTDVLSSSIDESIQNEALLSLRTLEYDYNLLDVMPYITEVFETHREPLHCLGKQRQKKKTNGIFYTPSDVSDYVVNTLIFSAFESKRKLNAMKWLDPACGTGSFLISAFNVVRKNTRIPPGKASLDFIRNCLFGIDISPIALQSLAYILLNHSFWNISEYKHVPYEIYNSISDNLILYDSTEIKNISSFDRLQNSLSNGADFVLSNPPYTKKTVISDSNGIAPVEMDVYPFFVKMMDHFSDPVNGAGCMVVPLSICYNTQRQFRNLRDFIRDTKGRWRFLNFDRTPDSLFGDDVKTRNTILFFQRSNETKISTSYLLRWNSRTRKTLFENIDIAEFEIVDIDDKIPKVGSVFGKDVFNILRKSCTNRLSSRISHIHPHDIESGFIIRNQNTAYNWLPFEVLSAENIPKDPQTSKYRYWKCRDQNETMLIFAFLQSRLTYWLWRITEDGFHLNASFILSLPFPDNDTMGMSKNKLQNIGEQLCKGTQKHPTYNRNANVLSVTYCPYKCTRLLDESDSLICNILGLPAKTQEYLKSFVNKTVMVDREDEMGINPALKNYYGGL